MNLIFTPSSCLHSRSKLSQCNRCEIICFTEAIHIKDNGVLLNEDLCVFCGACIGECPTNAFTFELSLETPTFSLLNCHEPNGQCLLSYSEEYLLSLALTQPLVIVKEHCPTCPKHYPFASMIERKIMNVNALLETKQQIQELSFPLIPPTRRDFFHAFKPKREKVFVQKEQDFSALRHKSIPLNRQNFLKVWHQTSSLVLSNTTFYSSKFITEDCTHCHMCYRLCPTSALSSDTRESQIFFNSLHCINCHLCIDVCEAHAIICDDTIAFGESSLLKTFVRTRCGECGALFTYHGNDVICPTCEKQENDARELLGW